jgi:hypothetical protein
MTTAQLDRPNHYDHIFEIGKDSFLFKACDEHKSAKKNGR